MDPAGQYGPIIPALGRQKQKNLWVEDQAALQSEFQVSQRHREKKVNSDGGRATNKYKFYDYFI